MVTFMANTNGGAGFPRKPRSSETGSIRSRMRKCRATDSGFCNAIGKGCVWMPAVMSGGWTREHWVCQQLIGLDFDNKSHDGKASVEPFRPADAVERLAGASITPMCLYHTYSSKPGWPRYRVVIELSQPHEDPDVMERAIASLLSLFPEADAKCKDLPRLFFGAAGPDSVIRLYESGGYEPTDIRTILSLPAPAASPSPGGRGMPVGAQGRSGPPRGKGLDELKGGYDLLALIQSDTGSPGSSRGDYVVFRNCPVCGHHDCFVYYPATNTWTCFSDSNATGVSGGSAIDYLMATRNVSLRDAIAAVSRP